MNVKAKELSEIINELKNDVSKLDLDNVVYFLNLIKDDEYVINELESQYKDETDIDIDLGYTINQYLLSFQTIADDEWKNTLISLLDFINSCGDIHNYLYEIYNSSNEKSNIDENICDICGEKKSNTKGLKVDKYFICHDCIEKQGMNESDLFEASNYRKTSIVDIYNDIINHDINIFENPQRYLNWMYQTDEDKAYFFDSLISDKINTGDLTLGEHLIETETRVLKTKSGKIIFFFDYI